MIADQGEDGLHPDPTSIKYLKLWCMCAYAWALSVINNIARHQFGDTRTQQDKTMSNCDSFTSWLCSWPEPDVPEETGFMFSWEVQQAPMGCTQNCLVNISAVDRLKAELTKSSSPTETHKAGG